MSYKIDFTTLGFGNYSYDEVDTKFTWIDGRTIYKKTINFGTLPNANQKAVAHGISNLNWVVKYEAFCEGVSEQICRPVVYTALRGGLGSVVLDIDLQNIVISTDSDRSPLHCYVTLFYTKM